MKIVIDSNVFVSSFFWQGNPRKVFDRVTNGFDELYLTDAILNELSNVMLRKKFSLEKHRVEEYIKVIEHFSIKLFHDDDIENISRDISDNKILKCGLAGDVDFIITGDYDLLVLKRYRNIKIASPKEYLDFMKNSPKL